MYFPRSEEVRGNLSSTSETDLKQRRFKLRELQSGGKYENIFKYTVFTEDRLFCDRAAFKTRTISRMSNAWFNLKYIFKFTRCRTKYIDKLSAIRPKRFKSAAMFKI